MPTSADRTQRGVPAKCASCNHPMDSPLFCDHCRSLHPAQGLNYFELLGLEPSFEIDPVLLRQRYLRISRGVHPDHHGGDDSSASQRLSAQLNEAHRVLTDPVLRAGYLLEMAGGKSATDDKSVSQDVLTATLMLREEIAEAKESDDASALEACAAQVRVRHEAALREITELAGELPGDEALRHRLRSALNAMKYYQKLQTEL